MIWEDMMQDCVRVNLTSTSDGLGGQTEALVDGDAFRGALVINDQAQPNIADKSESRSYYTLTTYKEVVFGYHDLFKSGGVTYRVTTTPKATPSIAGFQFNQVGAELYE